MGNFTQLNRKVLSTAILSMSCLFAFGAQSLPYSCDFSTQDKLSTWQVVDVDGDGVTWEIGKPDYGENMAKSQTAYSIFADTENRLISPALSLPAGKNIALKFKYFTSYYVTEILDIYLSKTPLTDSTEGGELIETLNLKNYYGQNQTVMIPSRETQGDYYVTFVHRATSDNNFGFVLYLTNLIVEEVKDGNLSGVVNGANGPLAGASVNISGAVNQSSVTDKDGRYTFEAIPADNYSVEFSAFGYTATTRSFEVTAEKTTDGSVTLYEMQKAVVSGKVADSEGTPLEGAEVRLEGYTGYRAYTNAEGKYEIPGVYLYDYYAGSPYTLTIQRNNFISPDSKRITMYRDYSAGTSTMQYDILPPHTVDIALNNNKTMVNWERPVTISNLKHDNGNPVVPLGYDSGRYENILGSIYNEPMRVSDVEWFTFNNGEENETITIYIIDLDKDGKPTGNIVYAAQDIANIQGEWNQYHIETPVECPNGFIVAMAGMGNVCLAKDDSETVEPYTQVCSNTYAVPGAYRYFEDLNYTGALCLRAAGEKIQPEIPLKLKYNLYRLNADDRADEGAWTTLATNIETTSFEDTAVSSLPRGTYRYAVKSVYSIGGKESDATLSPLYEHLQSTLLTVKVTTNSDPADAEGATVTLSRSNETPLVATVAKGSAIFNGVRKASDYHLSVSNKGFNTYETDLDLNHEESYTVTAELTQILAPVANIDVYDNDGVNTLIYDFFSDIEDSFETSDYADFEINPAGETGWQYIDGDGLYTYGFDGSYFPGIGERMAAIILDSSKTDPVLTRNVANTGSRALGFFCPRMAVTEEDDEIGRQADDWLITPELSFHRDFTFSFYAMTWERQELRYENIRVGYSTTGSQPEDFIFLDSEAGVNVPLTYTQYSYQIPKEAKYVALNSRSDDVFLLCVDDIKLASGCKHSGEAPSAGHFLNYEVSVNGSTPITTTSNSIDLDAYDLKSEKNTVQVVKVYNSGKSRPMTLEFNHSAISNLNVDRDFEIIYSHKRIDVTDSCRLIELFSLDGVCVAQAADASTLSVENLVSGVYIVRATSTDGKIKTARIAVK